MADRNRTRRASWRGVMEIISSSREKGRGGEWGEAAEITMLIPVHLKKSELLKFGLITQTFVVQVVSGMQSRTGVGKTRVSPSSNFS